VSAFQEDWHSGFNSPAITGRLTFVSLKPRFAKRDPVEDLASKGDGCFVCDVLLDHGVSLPSALLHEAAYFPATDCLHAGSGFAAAAQAVSAATTDQATDALTHHAVDVVLQCSSL
jgi:hypothetical protein